MMSRKGTGWKQRRDVAGAGPLQEPRPNGCALCGLVRFLSHPQVAPDLAGHGRGCCGSAVEHGNVAGMLEAGLPKPGKRGPHKKASARIQIHDRLIECSARIASIDIMIQFGRLLHRNT